MSFCKNNNKGVMSLAVVFVIGFFGLGLVTTVATAALVGINKNYNTNSGNQTFYTAETAVREGIYQYLADDSYATGTFNQPINNISTSSIPISVTSSWPYIGVEGTAENNLNNRRVRSALLLFPAGAAFDYAIYSEQDLTINGVGGPHNYISGDIFSNTEISCNGNPNIYGDAYSGGSDSSCGDDADSLSLGIDIITPPVINIEPFYKDAAIANGTDFYDAADGENYLNNQTHTSPPEIVYIEDAFNETNIQNAILTGSLAVKGNVQISGGTLITGANDNATIIVEGNLRITGNTTIYGLIYVTGTTNFSGGNNSIYGSIISVGGTETDIAGSLIIDYQGPSGPPGGIDDSGPPEIIGWEEM